MNLIDRQYAQALSLRLDRFKVTSTSPFKANFRCPICGDSKKSKLKARGWLLEKKDIGVYHCFNCGASMSLGKFIEQCFPDMYDEYIVDRRLSNYRRPVETLTKQIEQSVKSEFLTNKRILSGLTKISSLPHDHPAKRYVMSRQIPSDTHYLLFYVKAFNAWTNSLIPKKLSDEYDEGRLVIPMYNRQRRIVGYSGRALGEKNIKLRYITIMLDPESPKIFGLDRVDMTRSYYVLEGQLDSLFLPNAVAMAGADGWSALDNLENAVFVFDVEYRNAEIVSKMRKVIDAGHKICIMPKRYVSPAKDINQMIIQGMSRERVKKLIDTHTYTGLTAKLNLAEEAGGLNF